MEIEERHKKVLFLIKFINDICNKKKINYSLGYGSVLGAVRHHGFIPWDSDVDILVPYPEYKRLRSCIIEELPDDLKLYNWEIENKYHPCFDRLSYKNIDHDIIHIDIFPLTGLPEKDSSRKRFIKLCYVIYKVFHCKYQNLKYCHQNKKCLILMLKILLTIFPDKLIKYIYKKLQSKYSYENSKYCYTISSCYGLRDFNNKNVLSDTIKVPFENLYLPIPKDYDIYLKHLYGDYMTPKKY